MKEKRNLLIGIGLGAPVGWTLGFLRLPYISNNFSFWVGFISCVALVAAIFLLLITWNKNAFRFKLAAQKSEYTGGSSDATKIHKIFRLLPVLIILIGGFFIIKENKTLKSQVNIQNKKIEDQSEMIETIGRSNLTVLLSNLLEKVDKELQSSPTRKLSDETIGQIAVLNKSFLSYSYSEGDTLREKKYSNERGQLLSALAIMKIASKSFDKIKQKVSFAGANLTGVDLTDIDLSMVDLRDANLKNAILQGIDLSNADLRKANLWGANLNNATLLRANLKRVDLQWTEMYNAVLDSARLDGANLNSAKLKNASLKGTNFQWSILVNADFQETNSERAYFLGADLTRANFTRTTAPGANFTRTKLKEANFTDLDLAEAIINEKGWLKTLASQNVTGAKEIGKNYKIVDDPSALYKLRIKKIEE